MTKLDFDRLVEFWPSRLKGKKTCHVSVADCQERWLFQMPVLFNKHTYSSLR
jgi:hypothetical protein